MIDPTFRNINRLLVLSFKNGDNDPGRNSFDKYFMSLVKSKILNLLAQVHQDKEIQLFLNKLISLENSAKMMVEQCFVSLNISKNLY